MGSILPPEPARTIKIEPHKQNGRTLSSCSPGGSLPTEIVRTKEFAVFHPFSLAFTYVTNASFS
jgi:hypothetical protein